MLAGRRTWTAVAAAGIQRPRCQASRNAIGATILGVWWKPASPFTAGAEKARSLSKKSKFDQSPRVIAIRRQQRADGRNPRPNEGSRGGIHKDDLKWIETFLKRLKRFSGWYALASAIFLGEALRREYLVFDEETVPITGRRIRIDPNFKYPEEMVRAFKDGIFNRHWAHPGRLSDNHPAAKKVRSIVDKLVAAAGLQHLQWHTHVTPWLLKLQDPGKAMQLEEMARRGLIDLGHPRVNAYVIRIGDRAEVVVETGLLALAQDETQLAVILAHEIAHVVADHVRETQSRKAIDLMWRIPTYPIAFASLLALFAGGFIALETAVLTLPVSLAAPFAFNRYRDMSKRRACETEADLIGLWLMADAGFDPRAAPQVWQSMRRMEETEEERMRQLSRRMAKEGIGVKRDSSSALFESHPPTTGRIEFMIKYAPMVAALVGGFDIPSGSTISVPGEVAEWSRNWEAFKQKRGY